MPAHTDAQRFAAYPLSELAAAFAVGVVCERCIALPTLFPVSIAALTTLFAIVLLKHRGLATVFVIVAVFFLGSALAALEKYEVPANQLSRLITEGRIGVGEPIELTGVLVREPEHARDRLYIFMRVKALIFKGTERKVEGEVMLLAPLVGKSSEEEFDRLELHYGTRVRVMTVLDRTNAFRNPGVSSFTEYLDRKGYDAFGFVKSPLLIERLENEPVLIPLAWLYEWRYRLQKEIETRFSAETAGVLEAALLGIRYNLSQATSERFRDGGTFHVLVISGLHISFLGGLVFLITRRLVASRFVQFLFVTAILWIYALAVGADASVIRAALMFTIVIAASLVFRRHSSLNALGASALALLVWRPGNILDPSFQLTFASVLAIVVIAWPLLQKFSQIGAWRPSRETPYPPICAPWLRNLCESLFWSEREGKRELDHGTLSYKILKTPLAGTLERLRIQRVLRYTFGAVVVSVCVQAVLLPFLILYFHRLSISSLVLNIGVSLIMAGMAIAAVGGPVHSSSMWTAANR
ncbi:MAG: ComEC/Rec2 family competence protein [Pyrinomonadaceae bacterium]